MNKIFIIRFLRSSLKKETLWCHQHWSTGNSEASNFWSTRNKLSPQPHVAAAV